MKSLDQLYSQWNYSNSYISTWIWNKAFTRKIKSRIEIRAPLKWLSGVTNTSRVSHFIQSVFGSSAHNFSMSRKCICYELQHFSNLAQVENTTSKFNIELPNWFNLNNGRNICDQESDYDKLYSICIYGITSYVE